MSEPAASTVSVKDFVRDTLSEIIAGVWEAQLGNGGEYVGRSPSYTDGLNVARDDQGNTVMLVRFDLATTVEESQGRKAGGSVKVIAFAGVEGAGEQAARNAAVSRIEFVVPLAIPKPEQQRVQDRTDFADQERKKAAGMAQMAEDLRRIGRELA